MEIKNTLIRNGDPYRTQQLDRQSEVRPRKAPAEGAAQAPQAPSGDRVSLSSSAVLHTAAHQSAVNAPDVRQEKVDALKARVDAGEYQVDSRKVAEKLLQNEAFLAGSLSAEGA